MSESVYSPRRELDEVVRKLRRHPDLVAQLLNFAKLSLELHNRRVTGPVEMELHCLDGVVRTVKRIKRWEEEEKWR